MAGEDRADRPEPQDKYEPQEFNTTQNRPWDQPTADNNRTMTFHKKYETPPEIVPGLTMLDFSHETNIRVAINVGQMTNENFVASLQSWADTKLYQAAMTFLEKTSKFGYLQCGTYNTMDTRPWDQPRAKTSKRIEFTTPFSSPPKVITWLKQLDMCKGVNARVKVYPSGIDNKGFTVNCDTWADSILYSAGVTWIAHSADQPGVTSGKFSTNEFRNWMSPQHDNVSTVKFATPFHKTPKVILAIDGFEYDFKTNLRLKLSKQSVSTTELVWRAESWADSNMLSADGSFFAWA